VWDKVEHGYVDSNGVKIHYATMGKGPLLVMIHGFPDFWYSWRAQMAGLAENYQVVAIDQRGYNLSDKPQGQQNYDSFLGHVRAVGALPPVPPSSSATTGAGGWPGTSRWRIRN
jgi:pimeloyl-ACP methyl ester carboxylesterase